MIRPSSIAATYSRLTDEELCVIKTKEWDDLTEESRNLLKAELKKRGIVQQVSGNSPETVAEGYDLGQLSPDLIKWLSTQIIQRKTANDICEQLLDRGIDQSAAFSILLALPEYMESKEKHANHLIMTGFSVFVIGLAIRMLPLQSSSQLTMMILAYSLMIGGAIRCIHGYLRKQDMIKIKGKIPDFIRSVAELKRIAESRSNTDQSGAVIRYSTTYTR